jgi:CRISPR-associated protein Cst1
MSNKNIPNNTQMELDFTSDTKSSGEDNYIELFPGNWLYNASVIGFLLSIEQVEKIEVKEFLLKDGSVRLPKSIFKKLKVNERYFGENKISSIVGKAPVYRNYLQSSDKEKFNKYVKGLFFIQSDLGDHCSICNIGYNLSKERKEALINNGLEKFIIRNEKFNIIYNANLGPSINEFPNSFWNMKESGKICSLCSFLMIHSEIALTRLPDYSKIFINAPSFLLMYYLNSLILNNTGDSEIKKQNLLATSIIEFVTKTNKLLENWSSMNLEVVTNKKGEIDFFSLPYNTIQLISNRQIAGLLSNLGEFKILNAVLDGNYAIISDFGYKLLKLGMKDSLQKNDWDFINNSLYNKKNRNNLTLTAHKLFKLYALIQDRIKSK